MKEAELHNLRSSEAGTTILEVLVAGAIGLIVAFAIAKSSVGAAQAERESELTLAQAALLSRLENAIDDPVLCPSLWQYYNGTTWGPSVFDPAAAPAYVDLVQDGAATDVARTAGAPYNGPTTGVTIPATARMQFTDPTQVSENTYDWSLKVTMTKVPPGGGAISGSPTTIRRIRLEVTTNGSSPFTAISCGPPTSPEANQQIAPIRFTANSPSPACGATDAVKDTECQTYFGPTYVAAGLHELVAFRQFFSSQTSTFGSPIRFSVANNVHSFSNNNDGTGNRAPSTIYDQGTTGNCYVACVRNTTPLRFTRDFFPPGTVGKDAICQVHLGANYRVAHPNDLIRYGFKLQANGLAGNPGSPGAVFSDGSGCKMGWPSVASGPILDCNQGTTSFPIACVLK
jgi:hypothetical protein